MGRREDLELMRDTLWARLDAGNEPTAPLVGQLRQVVRELADLSEDVGDGLVDEIKARREARRAAAAKKAAGKK